MAILLFNPVVGHLLKDNRRSTILDMGLEIFFWIGVQVIGDERRSKMVITI